MPVHNDMHECLEALCLIMLSVRVATATIPAIQTQDGHMQASKQAIELTDAALKTLGYLMNVPAAAQTAIRLGLPALLNQLAQCPQFTAPITVTGLGPTGLVSCFYRLHLAPGGRGALLKELQPQSMSTMLTLTLDWLESPRYVELPFIGSDGSSQGHYDALGRPTCLKAAPLCLHRSLTVLPEALCTASAMLVQHRHRHSWNVLVFLHACIPITARSSHWEPLAWRGLV